MIKNFLCAWSFLVLISACSPKPAQKDPVSTSPDSSAIRDSLAFVESQKDSMNHDSMESTEKKMKEWDPGEVSYTGEQAIVYKTKKDYGKNVPVKMNAEKTKIVAYPSPKDMFYKDKLAYPVQLNLGYLLDNRGVTINSVFLNMTYDEYSKLDQAPLLSDMMKMIIDKDPFTEMYSLGTRSRFKNEVDDINEIIDREALKKFKRIK